MNVSQWPADLPFDRDQHMAFQALFKQWEVPYKEKEDVCQQAMAQGLGCLKETGQPEQYYEAQQAGGVKAF